MNAPPLCRCCGKPLAKKTIPHWVRADDALFTKDECQKLTSETVVSIRRGPGPYSDKSIQVVRMYTTWDGESYESLYGQGFFCTLRCAADFAQAFAKEGRTTVAYVAALVKQRERLKAEAEAAE